MWLDEIEEIIKTDLEKRENETLATLLRNALILRESDIKRMARVLRELAKISYTLLDSRPRDARKLATLLSDDAKELLK